MKRLIWTWSLMLFFLVQDIEAAGYLQKSTCECCVDLCLAWDGGSGSIACEEESPWGRGEWRDGGNEGVYPVRKLTWQWKIMENQPNLKMHFLLNMGIFHCHVSFQGCVQEIKCPFWGGWDGLDWSGLFSLKGGMVVVRHPWICWPLWKHFATKSLQLFPPFFIYTFYINFRQGFKFSNDFRFFAPMPEVTENWCPCCCHCLVYQSWIWASTIWNIWLYQERREEKNMKDGRSWCWCRDGDVVFFVGNVFFWKKNMSVGLFSKKPFNTKVFPSKKKFALHRIFFPDNHPPPLKTRTQEASKHTDTATNEMIPNSKDVHF